VANAYVVYLYFILLAIFYVIMHICETINSILTDLFILGPFKKYF
jgi:hypothetical protein